MRDYPLKVYLSTSWHEADAALSAYVVTALAKANLTVVGDHPDYQRDDPFDRPWTTRIHTLVADCSAVVAILPRRETVQTTSPYMFPELLAASDHKLPLLLFTHQGVQLTVDDATLIFGGAESTGETLSASSFFHTPETALENVRILELNELRYFSGPHLLPGLENINLLIDDFSTQHVKRTEGAFVFNILPFSLRNREHLEISKAIFEETGLPCRIALDDIGDSQTMRGKWKETLSAAEFAVADLTQLRDACLFETGVVLGLKKKLFLLARGSAPSLPYGLDDTPLLVYKSIGDLPEVVKKCCAEYKRKVYNIDPKFMSETGLSGVPKWFSSGPDATTISTKLSALCWVTSASLALLLWTIFVLIGSGDSPAAFFGVALTALFGLGAYVRDVRQFLESKFEKRTNQLLGSSIVFFVLTIIMLVAAYVWK